MIKKLLTLLLIIAIFGGIIYANNQYLISTFKESQVSFSTTSNKEITNYQDNSGFDVVSLYKKIQNSTVSIEATISKNNQIIGQSKGSGVIVSNNGYIVTNNHVVENATSFDVILYNGDKFEAKLIGTDEISDLAVLKIEAENLETITYANSDKLVVGENVIAIGNPLGLLENSVSNGIISGLNREIGVGAAKKNLIQTNAAINHGNSGGGLFNANGELVGIVVSKFGGETIEGVGFAIPSNNVKEITDELIKNGKVTFRPKLGIKILNIADQYTAFRYQVNKPGLYVAQVLESNSQFKVGDLLVKIDDKEITSFEQVLDIINSKKIGETIKVEVERNNQLVTFDADLFPKN